MRQGGNVVRKQIFYSERLDEMLGMLSRGGLLLASTREDGQSNVMTIGWATVGIIWGLPVMVVLVRPSRYTYQFIESSGVFTVNVPTPDMRPYVNLCGTKSGRDVDKLAEVTTKPGQEVNCVVLDDCPLVYECRVVHTNDVIPGNLMPDIVDRAYPSGDFHRVYYGQILRVSAR
jgi:flavin reductase (DIM6/NTAB) family NADH-FMN oxidoreductase RutF